MSDISDQIETDALKAKTVKVDGQEVTRRDLKDQIEGDRYTRSVAAGSGSIASFGLRISKLVPPGGG